MASEECEDDLRVLVVEDDWLIAADLAAMVQEDAADVVCMAVNTEEALDCARNWAPNAAFVDVNLEDGPTGPRIGRALSEEFGVAVVYATANPEQLAKAPGLAAAVKPVTSSCVHEALEVMRAHRKGLPPPNFERCSLVMAPFASTR